MSSPKPHLKLVSSTPVVTEPVSMGALLNAEPDWVIGVIRLQVRRMLTPWAGRIGDLDEDDLTQLVIEKLLDEKGPAARPMDPEHDDLMWFLRTYTRWRLTEVERKYLRRKELDPELPVKSKVPGYQATPEEWLAYYETTDRLVACLRKHLPPEDLSIFYMSFGQNLENPQIAERLDVSTKHVAHRKYVIRKRAHKCLQALPSETRGDP